MSQKSQRGSTPTAEYCVDRGNGNQHLIWKLGLHDIEIPSKGKVVLAQPGVGNDLLQFSLQIWIQVVQPALHPVLVIL